MEESKVTESKVTVMKRSMSDEVFDEAMKLTANAFASQENDKDIAEHIKTQLEKKFHGSWHCIVGKNFGCSVEFDPMAMCAYKISNKSIFLFRSPKYD